MNMLALDMDKKWVSTLLGFLQLVLILPAYMGK